MNYVKSGSALIVQGDRSGDDIADFAIKVFDVQALATDDFIL